MILLGHGVGCYINGRIEVLHKDLAIAETHRQQHTNIVNLLLLHNVREMSQGKAFLYFGLARSFQIAGMDCIFIVLISVRPQNYKLSLDNHDAWKNYDSKMQKE